MPANLVTSGDQSQQRRRPPFFQAGKFSFPLLSRTYIMGILNVTPDSFSDGGRYLDMDQAMFHAEEMLRQGADILDIGGESTRPGYTPVPAGQEIERVLPVIERLASQFDCPISIDTAKAEVADAALASGACIANDINGLQGDPGMAAVVRKHAAGVILMHNARLYRQESQNPESTDIIKDVSTFLRNGCLIADQAGVQPDQIIIDPGIGFGVTADESIAMISRLDELNVFGLPILIGPSRKRFISHILGPEAGRLNGTLAATVLGISRGADFIRVHDVREAAEAAKVADAVCRASRLI